MPKLNRRGSFSSKNQQGIVHILLLILLVAGIIVGVYLVQHRTNLLPKAGGGVSGPIVLQTSFVFSVANYSPGVGGLVPVKLLVRTDIAAANLFTAKINFNKGLLSIDHIDTSASFVKNWVENNFDNNAGTISLIGGVPNPGFQTDVNSAPGLMAVIYFKALNTGTDTVSFGDNSSIYSNADNINILTVKEPIKISIIPGGVCERPAPPPGCHYEIDSTNNPCGKLVCPSECGPTPEEGKCPAGFTCLINTSLPDAPGKCVPVSSPAPSPTSDKPYGWLDGASCTAFIGWACDNGNQAIRVDFFDSNTFIGETTANTYRGDLIAAGVCGGNGYHGFEFSIPSSLIDGNNHSIRAVGLNNGSLGNSTELLGSPKTINCIPPAPTACTLTSASWSPLSTTQGSAVRLNVTGNSACANQQVTFKVVRNGYSLNTIFSSDSNDVATQPDPIALNSNGNGTGEWIAEYNPLLSFLQIPGTNPQYYFVASVSNGSYVNTTDNLLTVTPGTGPTACSYNSTQARVQKNTSDPWEATKTVNPGDQVRVGGFHNGTGLLATDVNLNVTGPADFSSLGNGSFITATQSGIYTLTVTTQNQSGANCQDTATVQVGPVPSPAPGSGDGNGDGKVDLIDLSILLTDYNKNQGFRTGIDINGDGLVNSFDFSLMRNLLIKNGLIKGS